MWEKGIFIPTKKIVLIKQENRTWYGDFITDERLASHMMRKD